MSMGRRAAYVRSAIFLSALSLGAFSHAMAADAPLKPQFLQVGNEIFYPDHHVAPSDIDGDGASDLLWFNNATHQFAYWLTDSYSTNAGYVRGAYKIVNVTPGYYIGAIGDFNGDAKADLVWTSANNDLYLWTSQGGGFSSQYIGTYPAGWTLLGAGDIDGDGDADLLWWNESTCQFGYWIMHGSKIASLKTINVTCGYHVAAIGHFTPSTRVDLLWTSAANDVYEWANQGNGFVSTFLGNFDASGRIIGAALADDMNGVNVYVQNDTTLKFEQYVWRRFYNPQGQVASSTFELTNSFSISAGDYLGAVGSYANNNEGVTVWANDTSHGGSSPGALYWYTSTESNAGVGWHYMPMGSYPSGWTLVGARN